MKQIAGIDSNQFKVLIADDIPLNLILLDKMLKPFEFQITKANNGQEALDVITQRLNTPEQIDLLIIDIMMPILDGFKAIEYLRKGCHNNRYDIDPISKEELPIIILSGMNFNNDINTGMSLGANQYLTKPVIMEQLHSSVIRFLTYRVEHMKK